MEHIRKQLEDVWEKDLKNDCMRMISQQGIDNINMDAITNTLMEQGKGKIPEHVKTGAYNKIKEYLESQDAYKRFISI